MSLLCMYEYVNVRLNSKSATAASFYFILISDHIGARWCVACGAIDSYPFSPPLVILCNIFQRSRQDKSFTHRPKAILFP